MEQTKPKIYTYPFHIPKELKTSISISPLEKQIFEFLLSNNPKNSTFRVAGGWVRDKLLGNENEDIDITIDNISGQDYINLLSIENNPNIKIIKNSNIKSAHLKTATINLFGKDIDIVNLRKEVYNPNSRVPEISEGTVEEDAFRRDITINCLFYNINEKKIEDFTNQGINDLKNGIINTPKDSKISFKEDPLRILRVIRFATRFKFKLSDNIENNLMITDDFKNIITMQRIEKEFSKMLENNIYYASVYLLFKYKYLEYILDISNFKNKIQKSNKKLFLDEFCNIDQCVIFAMNCILIKLL